MSRWQLAPFGNLYLEGSRNGLSVTKANRGHGVPMVNMKELFANDFISDQHSELVPVTDEQLCKWKLFDGDLLFGRRSLTLAGAGKVSIIENPSHSAVFESSIIRTRLDPSKGSPLFYFYLFKSRPGRQIMETIVEQVAVAGIRSSDLSKLEVPVPPIEEQRRIASVFGILDDLIATERSIQQAALDMACAVYRRATVGSVNKVLLANAGTWLSGGTPSTSNPEYWDGDMPWISAMSLRSFFLMASDRRLTRAGIANGTRLVPAGSILFVVRGMSLKSEFRIGVAQREVAFGQDCKAIVVGDDLPKATIAIGLLSLTDEVLQQVDEASHGTGRLQTDRIERLPIMLPQADHIDDVERTLSALLTLGADAEVSITDLTRTRDELLPLLMSGKVRVTEDLGVA